MLAYIIGGFLFIVFIMIIASKRQNTHQEINNTLEKMVMEDWQGWVEIANQDGTPLFQGKMIATAQGHSGALLIGGLLEQTVIEPLIDAIKSKPFEYVKAGSILVRCLTSHDEKILMTKLEDQDIISRLSDIVDNTTRPETCLSINSVSIQHMDTPEALALFEKIWEDSLDYGNG